MLRDYRRPLYCIHCGGPHAGPDCPRSKASSAPLETPSHNGLYRGTIKVRELPPGVMSEMPTALSINDSSKTNTKMATVCKGCGADITKNMRFQRFCTERCRNHFYYVRAKGMRKVEGAHGTKPKA